MQFIFKHNTHALLPFLVEAGRYIETNLATGVHDALLHKCKFVLTELCTNGIKHSGQPLSIFEITIEDKQLTIHRKDNGLPFKPGLGKNATLLLPDKITDTIILTEDAINRLVMQQIDDYCVRFYVEEATDKKEDAIKTVGEHFGLIIICRSADNFIYTRHPNGENVFSVTLSL